MSRALISGRRGATAGVLLVGGGAVAAATWIGGDHGWAVAALAIYAVLAVLAFVWAGRSGDVAALLRAGGDERQRGLDRDATAITGLALSLVAVVGADPAPLVLAAAPDLGPARLGRQRGAGRCQPGVGASRAGPARMR